MPVYNHARKLVICDLLFAVLSLLLLGCEKITDYGVKVGDEVMIFQTYGDAPVVRGTILEITSEGMTLRWRKNISGVGGKKVFVPASQIGSITKEKDGSLNTFQ